MPSLIQCVLSDIIYPGSPETAEENLAMYDLDVAAISDVEGGWESVKIVNHNKPEHPDIPQNVFTRNKPPVYEFENFVIVRGTTIIDRPLWFVYEPSGLHTPS